MSAYPILVAIVLVATPLALGGVHEPVALAVAVAALGIWGAQLRALGRHFGSHPGLAPQVALSWPALGLVWFALWCAVQILPLPPSVVGAVTPSVEALFAQGWALAGQAGTPPPSLATLSLAPVQTADHGLRWLALAALAAVAANMGYSRVRFVRLLWLVQLGALLMLVVGLVQQVVFTPDHFLGFYQARVPWISLASFVNTNHAAVFYAVASLAALALALYLYRADPRLSLTASALSVAWLVAMAMHRSDATWMAFAISAVVMAAGFFLRAGLARQVAQWLARKSPRVMVAMALGLVLAGAGLAWTGGPAMWARSQDDSAWGQWVEEQGLARYLMVRAALQASAEYPVVGSGAGSSEYVVPGYLDWSRLRPASVPTIENEPVEWLLTFGPFNAAVGLLLLGSALWWSLRRVSPHSDRLRYLVAFALATFVALVCHFHFPFYTLGLSVVFVVVLEQALAPRAQLPREEGAALAPVQAPAARNRLSQRHEGMAWRPNGAHIYLPLRGAWGVWGLSLALAGFFAWSHFGRFGEGALPAASPPGELHAAGTAPARLEAVVEQVRVTPSRAALYGWLAREARRAGKANEALALAELAYRLEPLPNQLLLVARSHAHRANLGEAARDYAMLFDAEVFPFSNHTGWAHGPLLADVREAGQRAVALSRAGAQLRESTAHQIFGREGLDAAASFAMELMALQPEEPGHYRILIGLYNRAGEHALAELWARQLLARGLRDPETGTLAGYAQLANCLYLQNRGTEAWQVVELALSQGGRAGELDIWVMRLRAPDPAQSPPEHVERVRTAHLHACNPPPSAQQRPLCRHTQAWLQERDGQLDEAQATLASHAEQFHDPMPLGHFWLRHERCPQLQVYLRRLERLPEPLHGYRTGLEGLAQKCPAAIAP